LFVFALAIAALGQDYDWKLPKGFPRPVVPADNPMSEAKVELGRYFFYDKRMSVNGQQSCGGCHRQELAFTDGLARAKGATGQIHPRSTMSLVNVGYAPVLTWANPDLDWLEQQALTPMLGEQPVELGLKGREQQYLDTVRQDVRFQRLFATAFPQDDSPVTLGNITKAIASFERSIVSLRSPYDRYRWGGDLSALSDAGKRGEIIFFSSERGGCFRCHGGWNFGPVRVDGESARIPDRDLRGIFFNTGVSNYDAPNRGLFEFTQRTVDIGRFRVPTLRNVAVTAPYMHDGSIATLDEVVEHYAAGGKTNHANKSHLVRQLDLTAVDKRDLLEFLKSLTDEALLHDPRWSDPWAGATR
jgi:cytochrome c peroxidase